MLTSAHVLVVKSMRTVPQVVSSSMSASLMY
jgi:hypothetical protein